MGNKDLNVTLDIISVYNEVVKETTIGIHTTGEVVCIGNAKFN